MPGLNIGIDVGTSTITVFVQGKGIVLSEANAICYDSYSDDIVAIGNTAGEMFQKTPDSLILEKPVVGGNVSNFSSCAQIIAFYLNKICHNRIFRPNVIISAPSGGTALEKKAIIEAACTAGAGKVCLIDEPIISALGAGLSIDAPKGVMVIDLGAGTTDIAVISMGTVAYSVTLKTAGDTMDEAICQYIKRKHNVIIGHPTAKKIKHIVGCASERSEEIEITVTGKELLTGMPVNIPVTTTDMHEALEESVEQIFRGIMDVMDQLPAELYSDICTEGILLTGGMAKLYGLDLKLSSKLGIKVSRAIAPEHCAAKGAGFILKNLKRMEDNGYSFRSKEKMYN